MPSPKLADIRFVTNDRAARRRAFLAHLERFDSQSREVSWREAPAAFAATHDDDDDSTARLFRSAMEELLDSGDIIVERLDGGGNRLVRVPVAGRVREHRRMSYRGPKARCLRRRA